MYERDVRSLWDHYFVLTYTGIEAVEYYNWYFIWKKYNIQKELIVTWDDTQGLKKASILAAFL